MLIKLGDGHGILKQFQYNVETSSLQRRQNCWLANSTKIHIFICMLLSNNYVAMRKIHKKIELILFNILSLIYKIEPLASTKNHWNKFFLLNMIENSI